MIVNSIRKVKEIEHLQVLKLWEDSVRASHDFITETDIEDYRERISNSLINMELFCIEKAEEMQGFIALANYKIQLLFVHPKVYRQGIGKNLIDFAIQHHQACMVDVNAQNTRAVSFYKSLGFEVYQKFPNDGAGKPYPVWSLRLNHIKSKENIWQDWKNKLASILKL
ncbi:putative acetyltransferase [Pedobacter psychrotolerans]|uniref:Acetyltransferase n=1 Tax=Pedobacter psychrotolerans TaxID=1843235 RepID=A0A4R2H8K6_9SPHI|nr:GNAT family N-acetyltransferase [Pedobacter psychrotolerans]TCO22571.1 putative acetyltransferase [Pedobacter psychrotolerans]GGE65585.1 acetyltransferase [Pedobacter psychrotolerans]